MNTYFNPNLTSATVSDLRKAAGFASDKALSYVKKMAAVEIAKNIPGNPITSITREQVNGSERTRLEPGYYQLALRGPDGKTLTNPDGSYLPATVVKVDKSGKVTPSSKEEFIASNPDELRYTATPEQVERFTQGKEDGQGQGKTASLTPGGPTPMAKGAAAAVGQSQTKSEKPAPAKEAKEKEHSLA